MLGCASLCVYVCVNDHQCQSTPSIHRLYSSCVTGAQIGVKYAVCRFSRSHAIHSVHANMWFHDGDIHGNDRIFVVFLFVVDCM